MAQEKVNKSKNRRKKRSGRKSSSTALYAFMSALLRISFYVILIALLINIGRSTYRFGYQLFIREESHNTGQSYIITITEETDVLYLGKQLKATGIIEDAYVFLAQYYFFDYDLKPGEYRIYQDMSSRGVLDCLSSGTTERGETEDE